jgi:hypothetical protein
MPDSPEANATAGTGAAQGLAETHRAPDEHRPTHPEPDGSVEQDDPTEPDLDAVAIAERPRLWRALLFAHQADPHGRCLTCTGTRWPCAPRLLAEQAQHLHDAARRARD